MKYKSIYLSDREIDMIDAKTKGTGASAHKFIKYGLALALLNEDTLTQKEMDETISKLRTLGE